YEIAETLTGHTSSITVVLFSPDGEYLASGSESGVVLVTATESWETVKTLVNVSPVTALLWDPTFPVTLVCGFASGATLTVHIVATLSNLPSKQDRSEHGVWADTFDGPIHCISINDLGHILAIGHGREVTLLDQRTLSYWENNRTMPSPPEFTEGLPAPCPRVLHFMKDGRLVVAYMDHGIVCWDVASMSVLWNIVPRSCSLGWSAISPGEKHIVVSNLFDGLDFYSIANCTLSHSVPCPINQQSNALVPVLYSSDGSAVIVGGTSGSVRVLDSRSCETLQVLSHDGQL
ncbi:WD40-repeat-containing domain protein, partial [Thelephora terrestris]